MHIRVVVTGAGDAAAAVVAADGVVISLSPENSESEVTS